MRLLIAGAGGHGCVVADTAASCGTWTDIAFVDDRFPELLVVADWTLVGTLADIEALAAQFDACIAAFGDAALRLSVLARAGAAGLVQPVIVHPRAAVSSRARLGPGTVAFAGSAANIGVTAGAATILNTGCTVDHHCRIGDAVHICPGAHLGGNVTVGHRTWFGIGAVAKQGIRIGADVMVGAGAVCLRDIRDDAVVAGNPAEEIRK